MLLNRVECNIIMKDINPKNNSRSNISPLVGVSGRIVYIRNLTNDELNWSGNTKTFFSQSSQALLSNYSEYLALVHPEDRAIAQSRAEIEDEHLSLTYRLLSNADEYHLVRDDSYFVLDKHENRHLIVGLLEDVSELESLHGRVTRSESALSELEGHLELLGVETDQLKQLLAAAPDGLLLIDRDGKVLLANHEAEVLFGLPSSLLVGNGIAQLIEPLDQSSIVFPLESKSLFGAIIRDGIEVKPLNENSPVRYLELRARPIVDR